MKKIYNKYKKIKKYRNKKVQNGRFLQAECVNQFYSSFFLSFSLS